MSYYRVGAGEGIRMSYYRVGADSALTSFVAPETVKGMDLSRVRNRMKDRLLKAGMYPQSEMPDRALVPFTTNLEAQQVRQFWLVVSQNLGRPAMDARERYIALQRAWSTRWNQAPHPVLETRLPPLAAYEFWQDLSDLIIRLDNVRWAKSNIETALQRAIWAVSETAKEHGERIARPFKWTFYTISKYLKLALLVVGGLVVAYIVYRWSGR